MICASDKTVEFGLFYRGGLFLLVYVVICDVCCFRCFLAVVFLLIWIVLVVPVWRCVGLMVLLRCSFNSVDWLIFCVG